MNCSFCNIVENNTERILRETEHTFVVLSNPRLVSGHLLVIPKRHVEKISELNLEEQKDIWMETIRLQEKILEHIAPGCDISQHYRPFISDSRLKVGHLHIHIRPRFLNDELYEKVQIHEKDVFKDLEVEEFEEYKKLFFE